MEKKTLTINKKWIKAFVVSLILSFGIVYGLEHFGKFKFTPQYTLVGNGEVRYAENGMALPQEWIYNDFSKLASLSFVTPLGETIRLNCKYMLVRDIAYDDENAKGYDYRAKVYLRAVWAEKYLVFWLTLLFLLLYWFSTKFKLKIH